MDSLSELMSAHGYEEHDLGNGKQLCVPVLPVTARHELTIVAAIRPNAKIEGGFAIYVSEKLPEGHRDTVVNPWLEHWKIELLKQ